VSRVGVFFLFQFRFLKHLASQDQTPDVKRIKCIKCIKCIKRVN